jgi:hypothetical protein
MTHGSRRPTRQPPRLGRLPRSTNQSTSFSPSARSAVRRRWLPAQCDPSRSLVPPASSFLPQAVNGTPTKSFEGTVVHDATPRYIILKLKIYDEHDGKAFTEHYSGETTQQVFPNPKIPKIFGFFKSNIVVKDQKGKEVTVQGDFLWDTSRFPS